MNEARKECQNFILKISKNIFWTRTFVPDLHEAVITAEKDIDKIQAVVRTTGERDRIMEVLKAKFDLTISCALSNNIEVTAKDVNKGKGLLNLGKILGISRAEIMAFGDGLNDVDMLKEQILQWRWKMGEMK